MNRQIRFLILFLVSFIPLAALGTALASTSIRARAASPAAGGGGLVLTKTVALAPGPCGPADSLEVLPGSNVTYCYTAANTGPLTLTTHTLVDSDLGVLFNESFIDLSPGASLTYSTTRWITQSVVNTATWTALNVLNGPFTATDTASVSVIQPTIALTKTVSATPGVCGTGSSLTVMPGEPAHYCFEMVNTGLVTVTDHTLEDDQLGILLEDFSLLLAPGASFTISTTQVISDPVTNIAVWTATNTFGQSAMSADSAVVDVFLPDINFSKTVNQTPGLCLGSSVLQILPGETVHYCFEMTNTGPVTLTTHTLTDDHLGPLLSGLEQVVPPGESFVFSTTAVLTQSVVNIASWTATDAFGHQASGTDAAVVTVHPPEFDLVKTVSETADACAPTQAVTVPIGASVTYCFEITNTGLVTLTTHTLEDSHLGLLLDDLPLTIAPGQSFVYSETVALTESVTNLATWTAHDAFGNASSDTDAASVTVVAAGIQVLPSALTSSQLVSEVVTVTLMITNPGTAVLEWSLLENQHPANSPSVGAGEPGEVLFTLDLGAVTGSDLLTGVEYDGQSFWVSAGGIDGVEDANLLFRFDSLGVLTGVFTQTTPASGFGWRDLAFDGIFLYGSDDVVTGTGRIDQIDPATGQATGVTIPSPENPARALAYDPVTDHFWVANFGSDLYEIDRDGSVVNTFANTVGLIYGLAWDDFSPGGPYLWAWTFSPPFAVQIDPATGQPTGVSFAGSDVGGLGGGATITPGLIPDRLVLIGLHQALSDVVVGYDLGVSTGVCDGNGIDWLSVSASGGVIDPGESAALAVTLDSTGLLAGLYDGNLCITSTAHQEPLVVVPVQMVVGFGEKLFLPVTVRDP